MLEKRTLLFWHTRSDSGSDSSDIVDRKVFGNRGHNRTENWATGFV